MIAASAGSVRVFRVADGEQVASYPSKGLCGLSWDRRRRVLAFREFSMLHLWNPDSTDNDEKTIELRRPNPFGIAFAPDGSRMAVANGDYVSVFAIKSE